MKPVASPDGIRYRGVEYVYSTVQTPPPTFDQAVEAGSPWRRQARGPHAPGRAEPSNPLIPRRPEGLPSLSTAASAAVHYPYHAQIDGPKPLVVDPVDRPNFLTVEHDAEMVRGRVLPNCEKQ